MNIGLRISCRRFAAASMLALSASAACASGAFAAEREGERPSHAYDDKIAELARQHSVPEHLIHRIIMRESRYVPHAVHSGNYGLMQIRYGTARGMGYKGPPAGLKDPVVNLTYGVPYLANAWKLSGGDESRAVRLYAGGYYNVAKKHHLLGDLRTAQSEPPAPEPAAYAPPPSDDSPIASLFHALSGAPAAPQPQQP